MIRYILLMVIICAGCNPTLKRCECISANVELKVYNDMMNELVEKRSYDLYLGTDEEKIYKMYSANPADTVQIDKKVIELQHEIYDDSSRHCIIYLDTTNNPKLKGWSRYLKMDTSRFSMELREFIKQVSTDTDAAIDTLTAVQQKFSSSDFNLCTSRMKLFSAPISDTGCIIGKVQVSRMVFHPSGEKAMVFVRFRCGGLCGYEEFLLMEKDQDRWLIRKSLRLSVS
jgi:hypothetical protein